MISQFDTNNKISIVVSAELCVIWNGAMHRLNKFVMFWIEMAHSSVWTAQATDKNSNPLIGSKALRPNTKSLLLTKT